MQLTKKQEEGLNETLARYNHGERYVVISGYAGTGKTTLVKFIISALDVEPEKVAYAAFTGKAAEILRKNGNKNAMTLHKLLYDSIPRPGGGYFRKIKPALEYSIVVVDEVSMVPKSMVEILLRHKIFIIFLGDPEQLPQIDKNEAHNLLDHPHVFLDEIMRQAAESEIIQLTMKIRNEEIIPFTQGKEVMILPKEELTLGHLNWADQVICGTNATRHKLTEQMRTSLGYQSELPQNGEKMICLSNYWEDWSDNGDSALVNGMTGIIENPFETYRMAPRYVKMREHRIPLIQGNFILDDGQIFSQVPMDKELIRTGEPFLDWRESYALGKIKNRAGDFIPRSFTYGYAITCHKAQGSQFDKVTVIEETFPFDRIEHRRWLYTACTRPIEKLVLFR